MKDRRTKMLYEISFEFCGSAGTKFVRAGSDEEALAKFKDDWSDYGDTPPVSSWVSARWTVDEDE
jgi:hypothetical protein